MIYRFFLELKHLKFYFWIPVGVLFILIPAIDISIINSGKNALDAFGTIVNMNQQYIPFFSIWWPVFILKFYIDSPGIEILRVHRQKSDNIVIRMILLWLLYVAMVSVLFIFYKHFFYSVLVFYLLIVSQCLFAISVVYFISLLVKNSFLPMIAVFIYFLIFLLIIRDASISIFEIDSDLGDSYVAIKILIIFLCSIVILLLGFFFEKRVFKNIKFN